MLEQIKQKLENEDTQRAILKGAGLVATFVATRVFAHYTDKLVGIGIDALMDKLHPDVEVTATE